MGTPHVVLLDDDQQLRQVVQELLDDEGCTVATVANGNDALQLVKSAQPDVILTDWRLRDMTGGVFLSHYHALPGPHAPVVVLTADRTAIGAAYEAGAVKVLEKPFNLEELLKVVSLYSPCIDSV